MRRSAATSSGHQHPRLRPRSSSVSLKAALSTTLMLLCLIWFLLSAVLHVSSVPGIAGRLASSKTTALSTELLKRYLKLVATEERHQPPSSWENLDPNYVSKRRVPNGPDPIHNRRAVKYRQPPGA